MADTSPRRLRRVVFGASMIVDAIAVGILVTVLGTAQLELSILEHAAEWRGGVVGDVMRLASDVGYAHWLAPITALVALVILMAGRSPRAALLVAVATGLAPLVTTTLKHAFGRERPEIADHVVSGLSMPSGHATSSAAFALSLCLVVGALRGAAWLRAALVAFALVVGTSRVVLGVHHPTDVLAGWLLGSGIALLVAGLVLGDEPAAVQADGPIIR